MKTIEENNRMIAEFMGQLTKENNVDFGDRPFDGYCLHRIEKARYHESWDWLMPCVVKCFDVIDEEPSGDLSFKLNDALLETNIESLYKVVVEIVEWYNENL